MPVDDHPVHEKTKIGSDFKYGCWNHNQRFKGYYAPDRVYRPDGTFYVVLRFIKTEWIDYEVCPAKHDTPACAGCLHGEKK